MGRHSGKDTVDMVLLQKLYRFGLDDKQVAEILNVTEQTINNWKKSDEKFFASLKSWKGEADEKVEKSLYQRACGYSHPEEVIYQFQGKIIRANTIKHYPPEPISCIFWLKNRKRLEWKDRWDDDPDKEKLKDEDIEIFKRNGDKVDEYRQFLKN